jgi:hypothetical protein
MHRGHLADFEPAVADTAAANDMLLCNDKSFLQGRVSELPPAVMLMCFDGVVL